MSKRRSNRDRRARSDVVEINPWETKQRDTARRLIADHVLHPESLLGQINEQGEVPLLMSVLRFLSFQAAQCHCAAIDIFDQCRECGGHLTAAAPLARSTLLGASKIVGVLGPLFLESHDIAPACQLTHDELVNTYLANERLTSPEWNDVADAARASSWSATFRQGTRDELNLLRKRLGQKDLTEKEPLPRTTLVGEGIWIDWASVIAPDVIRIVEPAHTVIRKETLAHWYTGSAITHGGMHLQPSEDGTHLEAASLDLDGALQIVDAAGEMAACAAAMLKFGSTEPHPVVDDWAISNPVIRLTA